MAPYKVQVNVSRRVLCGLRLHIIGMPKEWELGNEEEEALLAFIVNETS